MEQQLEKIIEKYDSDKSFLIPMLQDVQKEFRYLPREALSGLSANLDVPLSRIYEAATFYKAFSLTPKGRHELCLCMGTACHVRGAPLVADHLERVLGIESGETTDDMEFTFETVNCVGACALGPVLEVDGETHGNITISGTTKILKNLGEKEAADE